MAKERVVILIDGSNFYHSSKRLGIANKINFQKLINEFVGDRQLVQVYYYNASLDLGANSKTYWKQQSFFGVLRKIPKVRVVLCRLRKVKRNGSVEYEIKGDDTHLVSDLVGGAYEDQYDTAIIVSGDEDFVSPIQRVRKLGKRIENAYFSSSSSYNLRKACDCSIHINKMINRIIN
ncbi:MAG: NYN domain-containing protein [candidate division Zixibacteria bacterium]|nr:NYN domain-containing protein [candidate division Zixibacteria bacterium]